MVRLYGVLSFYTNLLKFDVEILISLLLPLLLILSFSFLSK